MEKLREAHRFLEQSSARREKLEVTMRTRLEREVCRLKEANLRQRGEGWVTSPPTSPCPSPASTHTHSVGSAHTTLCDVFEDQVATEVCMLMNRLDWSIRLCDVISWHYLHYNCVLPKLGTSSPSLL